ncbi:MAG: hypothetical protein PUC12_16465 [Clostridiales bacterium]|nr:hypothetical protein [Clostridiales bacterium]
MSFSPSTRGRCWVGTIHIMNMEKAGLTKEQYENPEMLAQHFINLWEESGKGRHAGIAVCVSSKGCYHAHIACYGNTTTLKKVSEVLFQSHIEPQLGGKKELTAYLLKEGEYAEKGEQVLYSQGLEVIEDNQGKRNDLDEIEELLDEGYTPEEIFDESFRYRRYEKMVKSAYLSKRIKETPLKKEMWNEYHWGRSGTGKTYTYIKKCEQYSLEEVYLCNDYSNSGSSGGGFDFYANNPAKVVILDEFRGNMPYEKVLNILDVYSRKQQHCRYQNVYQLWTSVIVCSIYPPEQVYDFMVDEKHRNIDSIEQFMRRFNVIVYHYINKDGKYRTFEMPSCDYINAQDMIQRARENEKYADNLERLENEPIEETPIDIEEFKKQWNAVEVE